MLFYNPSDATADSGWISAEKERCLAYSRMIDGQFDIEASRSASKGRVVKRGRCVNSPSEKCTAQDSAKSRSIETLDENKSYG
jgi:hypothetical protein